MTANKQTLKGDLYFDNEGQVFKLDRGNIILKAESIADSNHELKCTISCSLVTRRGRWNFPGCRGHPDNPMLSFYRPAEEEDDLDDSNWVEVYESEVHPQETKNI